MSKIEETNDNNPSNENTTEKSSESIKKTKNLNSEDEKSQIESESNKGLDDEEEHEEEDTVNEEDEEEESKKFVSNKKPVIIDDDLSNDPVNSSKAEAVIAENKVILEELLNDLNYSVILTFFDKFREHLQIAEYTYKNLESNLLNTKASKL